MNIKSIAVILFISFLSTSPVLAQTDFGSGSYKSGNTGNLCIDEAVDFVKEGFGEQTQILSAWLDKSSVPEKDVRFFTVRVYTNLCNDEFMMTFGIFTLDDCKRARDMVPHMLQSASAVGSCKKLLPRTVYPKTYGH